MVSYLVTVFITEDTTNMPSLGDICSGNCLTEIIIPNDMFNLESIVYLSIHPTESSGPDGYHPHVLREVRKSIVTPLGVRPICQHNFGNNIGC